MDHFNQVQLGLFISLIVVKEAGLRAILIFTVETWGRNFLDCQKETTGVFTRLVHDLYSGICIIVVFCGQRKYFKGVIKSFYC